MRTEPTPAGGGARITERRLFVEARGRHRDHPAPGGKAAGPSPRVEG
ncbi:hypothetical protein ACFFX0_31400 [Citricoccus parietis]|uniref:Uncharacterized protein n=1 Tax=Citricoccus parietis TaxID=592307 RepID=A0ABV5G906_9MICC